MNTAAAAGGAPPVRLFLCGDVMTGRGIDQVLPHPAPPQLFEAWMRSAQGYVALAERAGGPIARGAAYGYPWGEALPWLERMQPALRIVNLETAVTLSEDAQPGKGIHYRMHPANVPCLTAAGTDCCVLANNHVLDWGREGLRETLASLHAAGLRTAGAGADADEAAEPAALPLAAGGRLLVFAYATADSGVPEDWAASGTRCGVNFLATASPQSAQRIAGLVLQRRRPGDLVVVSVHWGGNWGFGIGPQQRGFAQALIDAGAADIVHGHSSHHPKGVEVHRDRLVLYGCGDLINDYEGIEGHESWHPELAVMYFPQLAAATGELQELLLVPLRRRRLRLEPAAAGEASWLAQMLEREGRALGTHAEAAGEDLVRVAWARRAPAAAGRQAGRRAG
ncbi:CapA family protein [Ramlibacter sp.]|uniref:CapA family protein n=1 Tax=Ramlibacter sp. TaxID=1917967 RepID=UPI002B86DADE|nr:CapA family protein [Ramlibacter sp.]HWI81137.1 CapA family protein [Ramlibacter sp.]